MALKPCPQCRGQVSSTANQCPHCGHKLRTRGRGCLVVGAAVIAAFLFLPSLFPGDPAVNEAHKERTKTRDEALKTTKVHVQSWRKGGFDTVMLINAKIENNAPVAVHDIEITCTLSGKSGTTLGELTKIVYEEIPSKKHIFIKDFSMGALPQQASTASCAVTMLRI